MNFEKGILKGKNEKIPAGQFRSFLYRKEGPKAKGED